MRAWPLTVVMGCAARAAAPVPPAPVAACAGGYDHRDAVVSPSFTVSAAADRVCDLPDRIITVGAQVTVLARPTLAPTTAPIDHTDHKDASCDGPGGGHAGCSIAYVRYWSAALGAGRYLELGNNAGNALLDDQGNGPSCREDDSFGVIATCSTATRFLIVRFGEDAASATACWRVGGRLWQGAAAQPIELAGDVDRAASTGDRWAYRFPATATSAAVVLTLDRSTHRATLDVGGEHEACVAFRP